MSTKKYLINCGLRTVQSTCRISIKDMCTAYGIKEGQKIEVYIKLPEVSERK